MNGRKGGCTAGACHAGRGTSSTAHAQSTSQQPNLCLFRHVAQDIHRFGTVEQEDVGGAGAAGLSHTHGIAKGPRPAGVVKNNKGAVAAQVPL